MKDIDRSHTAMKLILMICLVANAVLVAQQTNPPQGQQPNPPTNQQQTPPGAQPQTPPSGQQQNPPADQPAGQAAPAPHKPDKSKPMARSQEEFNEYQAVLANQDVKAAATAANDFAKKYPESELRVPLFTRLMQKEYAANDADGTLEAAEKILAIEPDHTMALVISSTVLAERTRETDMDRDERLAKAVERAEHAVKTIDTGLVVPPEITPEQLAGAKQQLISMAHANMGYVELNRKNYAGAEKHYNDAIEAGKARPDSTSYLRLALAQHGQKKFGDALKNTNRALELAQAEGNAPVVQLAQEEKSKLEKAK
jgi:tetratricopeptide (TPR) repeat protein